MIVTHTEREREREREAETQAEGAGSMQGAQRGTRFRVPRIAPWAAGSAKPLHHRGCPHYYTFNGKFLLQCNFYTNF